MATREPASAQFGSEADLFRSVVQVGPTGTIDVNESIIRLLHEILQVQRHQMELLREMVTNARDHRQRQQGELQAWQQHNQGVVERCREALETLTRLHAAMLGDMADHVNDNVENLLESDFSVTDFVDRYGPRLHHVSAMLSVFKQLTAAASGQQGERQAKS